MTLWVMISSTLSWKFLSFVNTFRFSTCFTMPLTNSNRFRSAASTAFLSVRSMSACTYGAVCPAPFRDAAALTASFSPVCPADVDTVLTTGQPSFSERRFSSISVCFLSVTSLLLSATTTGTPSSRSCVVKKRLRLKFVASTILMMASGCSFLT